MAAEVPLDREAIKLLASDTRLDILKALKKRRMTVSELAAHLKLGKSTVFEHTTKLVEGGLVIRKDDPAREWVYYELSPTAQRLLSPDTAKIVLLFSSIAAVCLLAVAAAFLLLGPGAEENAPAHDPVAAARAMALPQDSDFLAGAAGTFTVGSSGLAEPAFYLITESQRDALNATGRVPTGAIPLDAEPAGPETYRLTVPAVAPGPYLLYARGADGEDNRESMPTVEADAPRVAAPGNLFIVGVDDPAAVPLAYDGAMLPIRGRVASNATLSSLAIYKSAPVPAMAPESSEAPEPAAGDAPAHDGERESDASAPALAVQYDDGFPAEGALLADVPRAALDPALLYAGEPVDLSLRLYHPARGVLGGVNLSVVANGTRLGAARTDGAGHALLALAAPPADAPVVLFAGDQPVMTLPVSRGLRLDVLGNLTEGENVTFLLTDRATGAAVENVTLVLEGRVTLIPTNAQGEAAFRAPRNGTYTLAATRDGYAPLERIVAVGPAPPVSAKETLVNFQVEPHTQAIVATVDLVNRGNETLEVAPALSVDGFTAAQEAVTVEPGETRTLTLVAPASAGLHNVTLEGSGLAPVTVSVGGIPPPFALRAGPGTLPAGAPAPGAGMSPSEAAEDQASEPAVPGFEALAVLAAAGVALAVARRRRA